MKTLVKITLFSVIVEEDTENEFIDSFENFLISNKDATEYNFDWETEEIEDGEHINP